MLRGPEISTTSQKHYEGYLHALEEYNIKPNLAYVHCGTLNMESGQQFARKILMHSNAPTAAFIGGDLMSYGVMDELIRNGIRIPEDISIVGFDDVPLSGTCFINLTTVRHPYDKIGTLVAERINKRIIGTDEQISKIVLVPTLEVRGSTAEPMTR